MLHDYAQVYGAGLVNGDTSSASFSFYVRGPFQITMNQVHNQKREDL